mmetsp:Transcript_8812/g.16678  ORF Transcript_8812/g.16678 Transcript_8812/m.16678 type:complete len:93 (+) Transcript_8812:575-853(+)
MWSFLGRLCCRLCTMCIPVGDLQLPLLDCLACSSWQEDARYTTAAMLAAIAAAGPIAGAFPGTEPMIGAEHEPAVNDLTDAVNDCAEHEPAF